MHRCKSGEICMFCYLRPRVLRAIQAALLELEPGGTGGAAADVRLEDDGAWFAYAADVRLEDDRARFAFAVQLFVLATDLASDCAADVQDVYRALLRSAGRPGSDLSAMEAGIEPEGGLS